MRNLKRTFAIISSMLIISSCSSDSVVTTGKNEEGTVSFDCSTLSAVNQITRAEDKYYIPEDLIPAAEDVELTISGSYFDAETSAEAQYSYGPVILSDYRISQPKMIAGDNYHADFAWGSAGEEGETAPYFSGSVDFEVIARGKTTEAVTLMLQNSIICVEFGDIFNNYYTDAEFTISTGSGNSFDFSADTPDKIVFVEAATSLTLSGSATKASNGSSVTFNATPIGKTTAQTLSRINIKAGSIGGGSLNITVDDTFTEIEPIQVELNPQGN